MISLKIFIFENLILTQVSLLFIKKNQNYYGFYYKKTIFIITFIYNQISNEYLEIHIIYINYFNNVNEKSNYIYK